MSDYPDGWFVPPELIKRRPQTKEDMLQVEIENLRTELSHAAFTCETLQARVAEAENLLRDVREQVPSLPTVLGVALSDYLRRVEIAADAAGGEGEG